MSAPSRRWALRLLVCALAVLGVAALRHFPWHLAGNALLHADMTALLAATLINLTSLLFKGTAWSLLLRTLGPSRWLAAQEATIVGSAVNSVSVSGIGEGARVQFLLAHDRVPMGDAVVSLVWSRVAEAIALALLILVAPLFLHVPAAVRQVHLSGLVAVALVGLVLLAGGWSLVAQWLPAPIRARLIPLAAMASPRRLWLPVLLSLGNWIAQWLTFHWAIAAVHVPVTYAASFTALVVSNIGGLLRVTPANVGVMQAAMVVALLPFGIAPGHAVAAGLALQALQVLPVLVMGAAIGGWRGLAAGGEQGALAGAAQK
jgi:uncharacterized membrane protein YbhN (UPF0104 family)